MTNAFEDQPKDEPIPEVEDPIKARRLAELEVDIDAIRWQNDRLHQMGLHRTADLNTGKLQRLLEEKRVLLEG